MLAEEDKKICEILQNDARRGYAEIGAEVGLSVSAIAERIWKLQATDVIRTWQAILDPVSVGCPVLAFLFVALHGKREEVAFRNQVRKWPEVLECHHITGDWSYFLKARLADIAELETIVQRLKELPGFARSYSVIAMSSVKETAKLPILQQSHGTHPLRASKKPIGNQVSGKKPTRRKHKTP